MDVKVRMLFKGIFALLMLLKDFNCYPFNGFYGCKDVFIWFQGEIVSCKYLMFASRHGLHMNPKYYCTEYTAQRCCQTCALLDRHNYRVINGFYQDSTTDLPTTTDFYDYMRVNEIYRAPSIDLPANSDVIRYKVFNAINEQTTPPAPAPPPLLERNNYNVLNDVNIENATVIPAIVDRSNNEFVNIIYKTTTNLPSRKTGDYTVTKGKSTHTTLFTITNIPVNEQLSTTKGPVSISPVSNLSNNDYGTELTHASVNESNVSFNITQTIQPNLQISGQTVEQFFTIPPHLTQPLKLGSTTGTANNRHITMATKINDFTTLMETTTPRQVTLNISTSFNSTFQPTQMTTQTQKITRSTTTQKPTGQKKRIRDGCVDVGIWVVNGSVPCSYLVKDNKYGLNRNQLYFCNRYPLTSCCETCKRINNEFGHTNHKEASTDGSQPVAEKMSNINVKSVANINSIVDKTPKNEMSTTISTFIQDSTVTLPTRTTQLQNIDIPKPLPNNTTPEQNQNSDIEQGTALSENDIVSSKHPTALPLRQNVENMIELITTKMPTIQTGDSKTIVMPNKSDHITAEVTKSVSGVTLPSKSLQTDSTDDTSNQRQDTNLTTTQTTIIAKAVSKKPCVDIGIWFSSGSISCEYLIKNHKYRLNKNPLYFCNKYPLTSCCKTCALIKLIIGS